MTANTIAFEIDEKGIASFVEDVQYLWCHSSTSTSSSASAVVTIVEEPPSALEFVRDYVAVSRPCIIRNALSFHLTVQDLVRQDPLMELVVDVSPDGHADVLRQVVVDQLQQDKDDNHTQTFFVQPQQRIMTVKAFQKTLDCQKNNQQTTKEDCSQREPFSRVFMASPKQPTKERTEDTNLDLPDESVVYYSRQNDCLRQELTHLWELNNKTLPRTFSWAEQAFNTGPPQAVNLWMGNERSVSSMHKDHYENLFYVASGQKIFTLCPPADAPFLYEQEYNSGQFQWDHEQQEWNVQVDFHPDETAKPDEPSRVRWVAADVTLKHDEQYLSKFPLVRYTHPMEVTVNQGELLYLPALWFHRVTQTCETVGINYWYDMNFESPVWTLFHLLQQLQSTG